MLIVCKLYEKEKECSYTIGFTICIKNYIRGVLKEVNEQLIKFLRETRLMEAV